MELVTILNMIESGTGTPVPLNSRSRSIFVPGWLASPEKKGGLELSVDGIICPALSPQCKKALNFIYGKTDLITDPEDQVNQRVQIVRNDTQFKHDVRFACDNKCIITGETDTDILEVAHIKPFSQCQNNFERYEPHNGLYLTISIHKWFDASPQKLCINPAGYLEINPDLRDNQAFMDSLTRQNLMQYINVKLPALEEYFAKYPRTKQYLLSNSGPN